MAHNNAAEGESSVTTCSRRPSNPLSTTTTDNEIDTDEGGLNIVSSQILDNTKTRKDYFWDSDDDDSSDDQEEEEEEVGEDDYDNTMCQQDLNRTDTVTQQERRPLLDKTSGHNESFGSAGSSDNSSSNSENNENNNRNRNQARMRMDPAGANHLPRTDNTIQLDAPIINVIDRIEDEVEAHAYEDLVPLEIKLALEDKVFGWSHLTSALLGHTLFTIGSYVLVNELMKLLWRLVKKTSVMPRYYIFIRISLSLWAAITAYRFVRRRRRVWFRAAYGTKAYKEDEARRRQTVKETDRSTTMGRMIRRFKQSRKLKKLRKAEKQFAKRHHFLKQKEQELKKLLTRRLIGANSTSDDSCDDLSGSESESSGSDSGTSSQESGFTDKTGSSSPEGGHRRHRHRRPSFHTKPVNRMESYAHDQVLFPPIENMMYAHGGFFGAAPFLLANPHWISILRHLMPDVYVEISRRVACSPPSRLIHWAENNPVVAAYGAAQALEFNSENQIIPNVEWDVFLDPFLVRRVHVVLEAREKYLATYPKSTSKQSKTILQYYKTELRKRSRALVDKMLIAHGSTTQLITEQIGYAKHYNYSRVKRTRKILGGGIFAKQWMAVFAEALKLGVVGGPVEMTSTKVVSAPQVSSKTASILDSDSKCPETSMSESMRIVESIARGKEPFGLVLDLKSRHVPKRVWSIVVDTLRAAGIRVEGIASFTVDEIRGVSRWCRDPVSEIIFFHSAGDLQQACHQGLIHQGDKIFLNGGSLLTETRSTDLLGRVVNFDPQEIKNSYRIQPFGMPRPPNETESAYPTISLYKEKYSLSIGLYCQEFAVDEAAIHLIARHVNENPSLFDLGLSWGGVNGITIQGISPGRFTSTDGFWNQRYIGALWDYSLSL